MKKKWLNVLVLFALVFAVALPASAFSACGILTNDPDSLVISGDYAYGQYWYDYSHYGNSHDTELAIIKYYGDSMIFSGALVNQSVQTSLLEKADKGTYLNNLRIWYVEQNLFGNDMFEVWVNVGEATNGNIYCGRFYGQGTYDYPGNIYWC